MHYSYAQLSGNDFGIFRIPISGIGLGNLLFPWARSIIAARSYGLKPIFPTWFQIKFGPILRGEKDKRFYHDLFHKPKDQIGGLRKLYLLSRAHRMTEDDFDSTPPKSDSRPVIVIFKGERDRFHQLQGWDPILLKELCHMTRRYWLKKANEIGEIPIGIHIRLGDYVDPESGQHLRLQVSLKVLLSWYIDSLEAIRDMAGFSVRACVFSDGREEELKEILAIKDVVQIDTGSAVSDLLVLSKAKILIASAGSSFSAWAAFLGQMPAISYPGHSLSWFNLVNSRGHYVGEFNPASPPPSFLEEVKASCLSVRGQK